MIIMVLSLWLRDIVRVFPVYPPSQFYQYLVRKLMLILLSRGGWKAELTWALQEWFVSPLFP